MVTAPCAVAGAGDCLHLFFIRILRKKNNQNKFCGGDKSRTYVIFWVANLVIFDMIKNSLMISMRAVGS